MQRHHSNKKAFTLIEVLVVVAIIALLVAILLPSLARARDQAQTTACASNMRQLYYAFTMYTQDNSGVYPGSTHDFEEDWLGYDNQKKNGNTGHGHAPEDGVIWKYMSGQSRAYTCPAHPPPRWADRDYWYYSYKLFGVMSGAKPEQVNGSHYPRKNFATSDHWESPEHPMEYLGSVPLLAECLVAYPKISGITAYENSWWVGGMSLANRHLKGSARVGVSNMVFTDGHTEGFRLPGLPENVKAQIRNGQYDAFDGSSSGGWSSNDYFHASSLCLHMGSGKWITARSLHPSWSNFGFLGFAPSADVGVTKYPYERVKGDINEDDPYWHWTPVQHPGD